MMKENDEESERVKMERGRGRERRLDGLQEERCYWSPVTGDRGDNGR